MSTPPEAPEPSALDRLAMAYGLERRYEDALGTTCTAGDDAVVAVLRALGAPIERATEAADALHARVLPPVPPAHLAGRPLPTRLAPGSRVALALTLEGGATERTEARVPDDASLSVPSVPEGLHRLEIEDAAGRAHSVLLVAAPRPLAAPEVAGFTLFAPVYALHDAQSEVGDFGTLGRLADAVADAGGEGVVTLPLLPLLSESPWDEVSPYAAASRLQWNELYVDLGASPECGGSPEARRLLAMHPALTTPDPLRPGARHVDWRAVTAHRSAVLDALAASLGEERQTAFATFLAEEPEVERYAAHRAAAHPPPDRERVALRHRYGQWLARTQLAALAARRPLHLDLPLGVHPDAYDVAAHPELYVAGVAAGAPPDPLFVGGQNWGFPPLHPGRLRASGYAHLIALLEHHLRPAASLRIDHVAWLRRLFWIPAGMPGTEGLYVRQEAPEELFALLAILGRRHACRIVGEDLGTVPPEVRTSMAAQGLRRTWVFQFGARAVHPCWDAPPADAVVALDTHDTATFLGWWEGRDVEERVALGLTSAEDAAKEHEGRRRVTAGLRSALGLEDDAGAEAAFAALATTLAGGEGETLQLALEDFFGERLPQNVPGTHRERPNWTRRAARPATDLRDDPALHGLLARIAAARKRATRS